MVLDSGATHHIFHDKSLFKNLSPIDKRVQTASGQIIIVAGIGSVNFNVGNLMNDLCKSIFLDNV